MLRVCVPFKTVFAAFLVFGSLLGALPSFAQEISTEPPKEYKRYLQVQLSDGKEAIENARSAADRVRDGESGSVLLSESIDWVGDDGRVIRARHEIFRANTEDRVEAVARTEVPYRKGEQRIHVAMARTMLADGTTVPVRAQSMFVQTPQDRADDALFTDQAELVILFPRVTAGASVEYVVVIEEDSFRIPGEYTGLFVLQYYWPADTIRRVVELPANLSNRLRITEVGEAVPVAVRETLPSGRSRLTWERRSSPSYEPTEWSQPLSEIGPAVWLSTLESWETLADWYRGLLAGRDELPAELAAQVDEWTDGLEQPIDIVRTLLQKVADDIRYTGLEFGIAGFQPKPPLEVWHDRFGDCKDKANLLRAVLAHKGIKSYMVLLDTEHAGKVETRSPDFRHFNHAILGIETAPESRRLLYADPTIPFLSPGVLGAGDTDRPVLVIRDSGYQFAQTPTQSAGELDILYDLEVDSEGLSGWVRLHVTGYRSSAYRTFWHKDELWQRRESIETFLSGWFPGAEVVDVETIVDDGSDDGEVSFVMRAYFLQRGEAFAAAREGEALPLPLPDPFLWTTPESLAKGGRGLAFLRSESNRVRVRYRLPEGWSALTLPQPFEAQPKFGGTTLAFMAGNWTCEPGLCSGELRLQQIQSTLDAGARKVLGDDLTGFESWLARSAEVVPSPGGAPETYMAQGRSGSDGSATSPSDGELEDFPRLTSAAGQLLLVDRKYPAGSPGPQRRAALSKVIQWFPGEEDADAVFESKIRLADLDCTAEDPAGAAAMTEALNDAGPGVSLETRAWGEYVRAGCSTVPRGEAWGVLRRLATDESLSNYRRFWSAYVLANGLQEAGRPASEALDALDLSPDDLGTELLGEKLVLEAWLRSDDADLAEHLAPYLEGEQAAEVLGKLTEAMQRWESMGAGDASANTYEALAPLLRERDDLADLAATLDGLGLSAADAEMYASAAAKVAEIMASDLAPEWWARISVENPDDEQALAAQTKKLGETELAAEYLRHLGELVSRYPERQGFGNDLWRFAALFDVHFPQEPVGAALIETVGLLPPSDPDRDELIFLQMKRAEREQGGEAAIALLEAAVADLATNERARTSLIYEHGKILERLGRPEEALETYSLLAPHRDTWIRATEADLRRALLHLDAGRYEAAMAIATLLAEVDDADIAQTGSPDQIRGLARLSKAPDEAMAYWRSHDEWFADWRALAADLGWTPPTAQEAAELGNQTAYGTEIGAMLTAKNTVGYLELTDGLLRAARFDPRLLPDAGIILVRGGQLDPSRMPELRRLAVGLLSTAPTAGSPLDSTDAGDRSLLLRTSILTDAERYEEADALRREYFETARPEGEVYRRMRLVQAMQANVTGDGVEDAAAGLHSALTPEWSDASRAQAVTVLAGLYETLGRDEAAVEMLTSEVERATSRDEKYATSLRQRLEALQAAEGEMAELEESLRLWKQEHAPPWLDFAEPHDLADDPWPSKPVDEWLDDDDLPATQKLKLAYLAALDDSLTPAVRKEAVASMPLAASEAQGWHRGRRLETLATWLDSERWDEDVREQAATWSAFTAATPESRERVESDPAFQLLAEGFQDWLRRSWRTEELTDGTLSEIEAEIGTLLESKQLDEEEAERLEVLLASLGYRFGPEPLERHVAALSDLRLEGEDHGGERLHLETSRMVRTLKEQAPLVEAMRKLAIGWLPAGREPQAPDDWEDLIGFPVTVAVLPSAEAEAHFLYELATHHGGSGSAGLVVGLYPFLGDGSDRWMGRFDVLLETALTHAPDDAARAGLVDGLPHQFRADPAQLKRLAEALSPWRRDAEAAQTRAVLRMTELYLSALEGESLDWAEAIESEQMKGFRSNLRSLQILDLAARGKREELSKILRERSFESLLSPGDVDDHLIAARAAGDEETEALLVKVARKEVDENILASWSRPGWEAAEWALRLAEVLGELERIPAEWFSYQQSSLGNEVMQATVALYEARRAEDWAAVGSAARRLAEMRPGALEMHWDLAQAARHAGDVDAATSHLRAFLDRAHGHWRYPQALDLCDALQCRDGGGP